MPLDTITTAPRPPQDPHPVPRRQHAAQLLAVIASVCIVGFATGITVPWLSLALHAAGVSPTRIGLAAAAPAIGTLLVVPFITPWSERYTTRALMAGSALLAALSMALLAVVPLTLFPALLLLRLLMGAACSVLFILGEAWINQMAGAGRRGRMVAAYATAFTLCQVSWPTVLSWVGSASFLPIALAVASHLLAGGVLYAGFPAGVKFCGEKSFGLLGFLKRAPAVAVAVGLFAFFDVGLLSLMSLYGLHYGYTERIALLMVTVVLVGDACLQMPLGALSDRLGRTPVQVGCGLMLLLTALGMPFMMQTSYVLWPWLVLFGASAGGIYTLGIIRLGDRFRGPDLVMANASVGLLWGVGSLLGPSVGGLTIDHFSPDGLMHALALLATLYLGALVWEARLKTV
jgi:MFS family permease